MCGDVELSAFGARAHWLSLRTVWVERINRIHTDVDSLARDRADVVSLILCSVAQSKGTYVLAGSLSSACVMDILLDDSALDDALDILAGSTCLLDSCIAWLSHRMLGIPVYAISSTMGDVIFTPDIPPEGDLAVEDRVVFCLSSNTLLGVNTKSDASGVIGRIIPMSA